MRKPVDVAQLSGDVARQRVRSSARRVVLIVLVATCVLASIAARAPFWDRDEPRFVEATVEMLTSGDWLVPRFDGELRADKPILVYWLMAVPVALFGPTELAGRAVSLAAAAGTLLLAARLARRWIGERSAPLAVALLATAPLFAVEGSLATTDALLLFLVTAFVATWDGAAPGTIGVGRALVLGLELGGAQLAKGPVGLVLPVLAVACAHALLRRSRAVPPPPDGLGRALALAIPLGIVVFGLWAIPANAATGGEFLRRGLGHHVVERVATPLEGHGGPWLLALPYYVPVVLVGFGPWSAFLPHLVVRARRDAEFRGTALRVIGVAAPTLVLMSLVATKLPHYVLPAWPALSIGVAAAIADESCVSRGVDRAAAAIVVVLALLETAALFVLSDRIGLGDHRLACLAPALPSVVAAVLAGAALRAGDRVRAAWILAAGRAAFFACAAVWTLPAVGSLQVAPRLVAAVREHGPVDAPVARIDFLEPGFDVYLGRPPIEELASDADVVAWSARDGPGVLIVAASRWNRVCAIGTVSDARILARETGFNFAKGRAVELLVVARLEAGEQRTGPR